MGAAAFSDPGFTEPVPYAQFFRASSHTPRRFLPEAPVHCLVIYHELRFLRRHYFHDAPPLGTRMERALGYAVKEGNKWFYVNDHDEAIYVNGTDPVQRQESVEIVPGLKLLMSSAPNGRLLIFDQWQSGR
jgi:hypothetical protein